MMANKPRQQKVITAWRLGLQFDAEQNLKYRELRLEEQAVRDMVECINAILTGTACSPQLLLDPDFDPVNDIDATWETSP